MPQTCFTSNLAKAACRLGAQVVEPGTRSRYKARASSDKVGIFITEDICFNSEDVEKSHNPIDVGGELVIFLAPGGQHHCIASHQSQGESAKKLTRSHTFFEPLAWFYD